MEKDKRWHHTQAAKDKIRAARLGRKLGDATKEKIGKKTAAMWRKIRQSGCLDNTAA